MLFLLIKLGIGYYFFIYYLAYVHLTFLYF